MKISLITIKVPTNAQTFLICVGAVLCGELHAIMARK